MKRLLTSILATLCLCAHALGATAGNSNADIMIPCRGLDTRDGLPESRIRGIAQIGDGRMAFLTSGHITLYNWSKPTSWRFDDDKSIPLPGYQSYKYIMADNENCIWIKDNGRLLAFDPSIPAQLDREAIIRKLGNDSIVNFFTSPDDWSASVTADKQLTFRNGGKRHYILGSLADTDTDRLERAVVYDSKLILCYQAGFVAVYDTRQKQRLYQGYLTTPIQSEKAVKGVSAAMNGNILAVSVNYAGWKESSVFLFDTDRFQVISSVELPFHINDITIASDGFLVAGKDFVAVDKSGNLRQVGVWGQTSDHCPEIFCMFNDSYGGLWLGLTESGLLHHNPGRINQSIMHPSPYPHARLATFCDGRAKQMAERHARLTTNCSHIAADGTLYLGTRDGLAVIGKNGNISTIITEKDGLDSNNIHAITTDRQGRLWLTTPTGINMLKKVNETQFLITSFGVLDGISLNGLEFRPNEIAIDSSAVLRAAYPGGFCEMNTNEPFTNRHYTLSGGHPGGSSVPLKEKQYSKTITLIITGIATAIFILAAGLLARRRKQKPIHADTAMGDVPMEHPVMGDAPVPYGKNDNNIFLTSIAPVEIENPDTQFLKKLKATTESNISDPELNVEKLSSLLGIDRITLFRKMKQLSDFTPSNYIRETRLIHAREILSNHPMLSVSEVAYNAGFSNPKYFTQLFRERFGCTPTEFRKGMTCTDGERDTGQSELPAHARLEERGEGFQPQEGDVGE